MKHILQKKNASFRNDKINFSYRGLGYIGSHTCVELLQTGYNVIIADDLSNSEQFILERIIKIAGVKPLLYEIDLCDAAKTRKLFAENNIDAVIHFAASKAVGESVQFPLKYYRNNIIPLLNLLDCMGEFPVDNFVFSSSCTVYGQPDKLPVTEQTPFKKSLSAYGSTKQMGEEILEKVSEVGIIKAIALRYFNPVGAHGSALIGELPKGTPQNLVPFITQTAIGKRDELTVFGNDYNTADGTCVRDYIHVTDLAKAHVKATDRLLQNKNKYPFEAFNIGTGNGYSVIEIIKAFEKVSGQKLNYKIGSRRSGDSETIYADTDLAKNVLGWCAALGIDEMLHSAWEWEKQLPIN